jgi:4-amino-4-deoxy-L-arabinose transferase-like glycosyltransferase
MPAVVDRAFALLAAALIVVFGFLPWANWIPGGHEAEWYPIVIGDWFSGGTITVGVGLVLAILSRRIAWLWRPGALQPLLAGYDRRPLVVSAAIAAVAMTLYLVLAVVVFDTKPLLIDEMIQVFQGRTFASGRLVRDAFAYPEFFSGMHLIDTGGSVYGQFPAGGPAMLALGSLVGAEWVVGPVAAALTVFVFGWLVQHLDSNPGVRLGATLLFAFAPFAVFMASSHMNHVTVVLWLVAAMACLARVTTRDRAPWAALGCGLGLGVAATIRPADALAFALPAGVWLLARTLRRPARWPDLMLSGVGVALPVVAMLWVNSQTTGHPLLFGYTVLWGNAHDLGFHGAPWGDVHTPLRGVELLNLYFLRLQTYLFESPFASLVPTALALAVSRRLQPFDRYLLISGGLIVGLYFAYWHDGFYLGPRFMYPLVPLLVLWTARLPGLLRERFGDGLANRTAAYSYAIAAVVVVAVTGPIRGTEYAHGLLTPRWDADAAVEQAGVEGALILVRESWGAQIMARLWARGIGRSEAELLYRKIDTCILEEQLSALEASGVSGSAASAALQPFLADSAKVIVSPHSPDPTERYLPAAFYSDRCRTRVQDNWQGFTLFAPLLLAGGRDNVFARDLHARDTLLLAAFPDRPIYLLKPEDARVASPKRFYPVTRDSLRQAWGLEELP